MEESKSVEEGKVTNVNNAFNANNIPENYKPISMWGYFGYELLFSIPCIGIILLLVFAFGGTQNVNLKNFARSYFCVLILILVLGAIITLIFGVTFSNLVSNTGNFA